VAGDAEEKADASEEEERDEEEINIEN